MVIIENFQLGLEMLELPAPYLFWISGCG